MTYLITFLAFILRVTSVGQSLWLDEAIGALVVKNMSFWDIATKFAISDNHPPLYYLTLSLWTSVFGYSEISLRMPSVFFGVGIVFLVYKITKNKLATLLTATAPLLVYYSQESRMYMMAAFLSTLAIYLFQKKKYFFLSTTLVALIFTDYVPVFLLPVFLIYAFLKKDIMKTIFSYLPLAVVGLLWLPIFLKQIETGRVLVETLPAWHELAGGVTFKQAILFWNKLIMGRISFYPKKIYFLLLILSSIPYLVSFLKSIKKENLLYILWFVVPLVFGFIVSFVFPAFIYFRFIFVLPAFYILVAQTKNKLLITLMILVNLVSLGIYYFDVKQQRENWREATSFVESNMKDNEVAGFIYPEPFAPYKWYSKNDGLGLTSSISVSSVDLSKTKDLKGLYLFNYLEDLTDPKHITRRMIYDLGFKNIKTYTFNGVGEVEYLINR